MDLGAIVGAAGVHLGHHGFHLPLTSAIDKLQQHRQFRVRWKLNLGLLAEKQVCYLCAMHKPDWFEGHFSSYFLWRFPRLFSQEEWDSNLQT